MKKSREHNTNTVCVFVDTPYPIDIENKVSLFTLWCFTNNIFLFEIILILTDRIEQYLKW